MKVAFLSTFALDANVSLISKLNEKCDIYFFTEALLKINYIDKDKLTKFISKGDEVDEIKRFENLIPLDKTYVIKGVRQRELFKKVYNSYKINAYDYACPTAEFVDGSGKISGKKKIQLSDGEGFGKDHGYGHENKKVPRLVVGQ